MELNVEWPLSRRLQQNKPFIVEEHQRSHGKQASIKDNILESSSSQKEEFQKCVIVSNRRILKERE